VQDQLEAHGTTELLLEQVTGCSPIPRLKMSGISSSELVNYVD
jgi:hypothetical protein